MLIKRKLVQTYTPQGEPGFLGRGHIARPVIQRNFAESDPFILLMDDMLDKKDNEPVGGPHPHAGFETVTLLLEGELGVGPHKMNRGDFQMMTAGSGVIPTETIDSVLKMRLLQLWLGLPKRDRWTMPRVQDIPLQQVPKKSTDGVEIKLYSGSFAGLKSSIKNHTPVIIADVSFDSNTTTIQQIPANFNTFLYVLKGSVEVGDDQKLIREDQVGWLDLFKEEAQSELKLTSGKDGVRFVLYSGKPTCEPIVSHGPFIAGNSEEIARLYKEYRQGKMKHISTVPESQRILL